MNTLMVNRRSHCYLLIYLFIVYELIYLFVYLFIHFARTATPSYEEKILQKSPKYWVYVMNIF